MFNYTSEKQLSIFDFKTQFGTKLSANNRWVKMANLLDWDTLASIYAKTMSSDTGAPGIDARVIIGTVIIKHLEKKDDRGTIEIITENPYMQYFLGLSEFTDEPVFDPSLLVTIRKRLGGDIFDEMNQAIIAKALLINNKKENIQANDARKEEKEGDGLPQNKGKLQLDATVCDVNIKFPTDLNLVNESREKSEQLLDRLCIKLKITRPRTYRRIARKDYLNMAKKKRKSVKEIRKGVKTQLNYLRRNLKFLDIVLSGNENAINILNEKEQAYFETIKKVYEQQNFMQTENTNRVENRIVSIHQPHVRPIVRGKDGKKVEFGPKINVSLQNGYARINQFDFEAFNEGRFMIEQIESFLRLTGFYPALLQTDDLYMTRENRNYLKERGIRHTGRPLGRKPKEALPKLEKKQLRKERAERNQIEGKFGEGKRKYDLGKIMAKLPETQQSMISAIFFVMNIRKFLRDIFVLFWQWRLFRPNFEKSYYNFAA